MIFSISLMNLDRKYVEIMEDFLMFSIYSLSFLTKHSLKKWEMS